MNPAILSRRSRPGDTARVALLAVLASETIFFATLLSAYFFLRQSQTSWPLAHVAFNRLLLPGFNTGVLVVSALTMALALRAIQKGSPVGLKTWLAVTLLLGLVFVGLQVVEFTRSGMRADDQTFGGVFFTLMGFHALHILGGVIMLALILARAALGDFTARRHVAVEIGAWFWYFIVGVWVVLFVALYLV